MTIHSTDLDRADQNIRDAQQSSSLPPLILTTGEPAGIGMDIVLQLALAGDFTSLDYPVVVLADEQALQQRLEQVYGRQIQSLDAPLWQRIAEASEVTNTVESSQHFLTEKILQAKSTGFEAESSPKFYLIHVGCNQPVIAGQLNVDNAVMVITQLQIAHKLAQSGAASAIVTGPLQKSVLIEAGITLEDGSMFTGHTEFFMQKSGCDKVVMMLANNAMKVALVTIHMPLKEVAAAITPDNVRQTVQILLNDLQQKFGLKDPRVLVCGLNPHAGEDGHLGTEEIEVINPVLKQFQDQGVNISSAMPADTLFTQRHLKHCDAVIAMYHDQGLPVLKSHGFGDTVNLTLGLPYIRTSVDHGTALDLAGKRNHEGAEASDAESGQASSSSLWQALTMANDMVKSTLGLR